MKSLITLLGRTAILAALVFVAGCATQGAQKLIPVSMPDGQGGVVNANIVVHPQNVPDWMLSQSKLKLNYIIRGDLNPAQLEAVANAEVACRIFTNDTRSNLVAIVSSAGVYALAGAVGLYFGSGAFSFATKVYQRESAMYGASASGFSGAANGLITMGGQTYTFENCGRELLALVPANGVKVLGKSPY